MTVHRRILVVLLDLGFVAAASTGATQVHWHALEQPAPRAAIASKAIGMKDSKELLHISIALPYRDAAGMQRFVDSVSNPRSPDYRKFITPEQIGQRFGLALSDVKRVTDYLGSQGISIRLVGKNRLSILADATVAQAQHAFHVTIEEFSSTAPGAQGPVHCFSTTTAPSVPASLAKLVSYIGGLENFNRPVPTDALTPDQFRTLYSIAPLYSKGYQGQGRTVAISNWVTYGLFNVPLEYGHWNLPTPPNGVGKNVKVVSVDGSNGNVSSGAQAECDIDIQAVLAMAPLCNLILYDNAYNSDIIGVLTQEADDNLADLVSESYAWNGPTPMFVAAHNLHLAMSAQGITYICASGDWGAQGAVNLYYPDEDPEVLSVGGTSVWTDTPGNRTSEVVWGGSGGGWAPNADPFNVRPAYQTGVGLPANVTYRLFPDVALDADPGTGYIIYLNGYLEAGWGGTSCSSPTVAGGLAACEQLIIACGGLPADGVGNRRFGRIQDLLYSLNGDPTVFHDITAGGNGWLPDGTASNATTGWDTATGWGTLLFSGLAARVLNYPPIAALSVSPPTVAGGSNATGTVTFASAVGASNTTLYLSSNNPLATVPASLSISTGSTSATFQVVTQGVLSPQTVTISASFAGSTQSAVLNVIPGTLQSLSIAPKAVVGGTGAVGTVTLSGEAASGGATVSLSSNNSAVSVPSSVVIAAGTTSGTFSVTTVGQSTAVSATIIATLGGASANATLTVNPAVLTGVSVSPNPVTGGNASTGTVSLSGPAPPGGDVVTLAATNATVPSTITIPAGTSSGTFAVTTKPVTSSVVATISATLGVVTKSSSLTVQTPVLSGVSLSPSSVVGGGKSVVTGTVSLSGPAPTPGITVALASSNTKLATVPATVKILAGKSSISFTVTHRAVASTQTVAITAKAGTVTQQATLTLQPPSLVSLSISPSTVKGSSTVAVTGTVTISGPSPTGGVIVKLSSSAALVAGVPASVTIPAGKSSATFKVTHKKVTSSTSVSIAASLGQASVTTTLTVTP
ncbi:MAG: protease pro-enzyme activation domain-containing protein [Fimbriimonas sp.]|nr:protease pro-enzyme activation domain-containing protein [Fimbriimonas sp.]